MISFFNLETRKAQSYELIYRYYPKYQNQFSVFQDLVLQALRSMENARVLDAGCGKGLGLNVGVERPLNLKKLIGNKSVGVDAVFEEVSFNPYLHYRPVGDIQDLPFKSNCFDIVISQHVIEHLPQPEKFFGEVSRVLKKGGVFILMTPNKYHYVTLISRLTPLSFHQRVVKNLFDVSENDAFATYYRANTERTLRALLSLSGMKPMDIHMYEGFPSYLTFSKTLCMLGILYDRLISRFESLRFLRGSIIVKAVRS
ncbi:MAG: class I SAM-dependent methyltransferase [bacterium]